MADHPNLTMLKQIWGGLFGDNQTKLFTRVGEVAGPVIAPFVLNAQVSRRSDGKPTTWATELSWLSVNFAQLRAEQQATREVILAALANQTGGVDVADLVAQVEAATTRAFEKNLKGITADVTLTVAKES
ncbi:hypothetical protein [Arthrobacter agilis]|uniref:hypothetical protein n=1 Tax=Arthrobacter agilis TaxID=37921 RepID=UPI00278A0757|nr:hypothetical protein [Arthrobacter agilis]MDQ0735342.1 hypothetical protein [Arthrobacter agilis]